MLATNPRRRSTSETRVSFFQDDSPKDLISLKDYLRLNPLPCVATIFRRLGNNPPERNSQMDSEEVYIHSMETATNAVAEEVDFCGKGKTVKTTPKKFLIPLEYSGWFEVLSQDGRSTRPIESVKELSQLVASSSFLVREQVHGYTRVADGRYAKDVVVKGKVLRFRDVTGVPAGSGFAKEDLLTCVDQLGNLIYLSMECRGLFSPIACPSSIAGAHDIRSLLEKFRLPVIVRLLHGNVHSKDASRIGGPGRIFRLIGTYSEEVAYLLPLNSTLVAEKVGSEIISVSTKGSHLMVKPATKEWTNSGHDLRSLTKLYNSQLVTHKDTIRPLSHPEHHWLLANKEINVSQLVVKYNATISDTNITEILPHPFTPEEKRLLHEIEDLYAEVRYPQRFLNQPDPRKWQYRTQIGRTIKSSRNFNMAALADRPFLLPGQPVANGNALKLVPNHTSFPGQGERFDLQKMGNETFHATGDILCDRRHAPKMEYFRGTRIKDNVYEEIPFLKSQNGDVEVVRGVYLPKKQLESPVALRSVKFEPREGSISKLPSLQWTTMNGKQKRQPETTVVVSSPKTDVRRQSISVTTGPFQRDISVHRSFRPDKVGQSRTTLLRPQSYAGTLSTDQQLTELFGPNVTRPALPPKRFVSLTNLNVLTEIQHQKVKPNVPTSPRQSSDETRLSQINPSYHEPKGSAGSRNDGTVSRSLAKTLRQLGNKTSDILIVNSGKNLTSPQDKDTNPTPYFRAEPFQKLSVHNAKNDDVFLTYI